MWVDRDPLSRLRPRRMELSSQEETLKSLLELGDLAERRTRADVLLRALRMSEMLTDADAVVALIPESRAGQRLALYAGSEVPAKLQSSRQGSEVIRVFQESWMPLAIPDLSESPFAATDGCPGVESGPVLFTPLRLRQPEPAYFAIYRRIGRAPFHTHDVRTMLVLGAWLGAALENLRIATGTERL